MKTQVFKTIVFVLIVISSLAIAANKALVGSEDVSIAISPGTIVLSSAGECLSVHSNIVYADVAADTIKLSGLEPTLVKADDCGYLVAKFDLDTVKEMVSAPSATLTLTGQMADGTEINASDTVSVRAGK